ACLPLFYPPADAYQFLWSHEIFLLTGVTGTVKVTHVRLCHSRMMFVRPIHARRRRWCATPTIGPSPSFGGACTRGIYDNRKTAAETVFAGKERQYNWRFSQTCSHYLVQPVACTPASG